MLLCNNISIDSFSVNNKFRVNQCTTTSDILLFTSRYSNYEDMVAIIPGLSKKGPLGFSKETNEFHEDSVDCMADSQHIQEPTVIL